MKVTAKIENLSYEPTLYTPLRKYSIDDFLSGKSFRDAVFVLCYEGCNLSISRWVSPKRTRSYPYARVYDTIKNRDKITIIPFVKDEGLDGDMDFVQWDTISLMSLLGVYTVLGYYKKAIRSSKYRNKITKQEFDYEYLKEKIDEYRKYKSDALHWNIKELSIDLIEVAKRSIDCYQAISKKSGVILHGSKGMDRRIKLLQENALHFKERSRKLARMAQKREAITTQPKEKVIEDKATITIENYLGGIYYFTIDDPVLIGKDLFLIEKKHSQNVPIPSSEDIKDGIVKMILFKNLSRVQIRKINYRHHPVLGLTSANYKGYCYNTCPYFKECDLKNCKTNDEKSNLGPQHIKLIRNVFNEGIKNGYLIFIMDSHQPELQSEILQLYKKYFYSK